MAIAVVKDFDAKLFEFNGIKYVRNFVAVKSGDFVRITNAYDTRFALISSHYTSYLVNGGSYGSSDSLVTALSSILFVKDEVTAISGESTNASNEAIFSNKDGTWINSPAIPLTTATINLNLTNSKNGAVSPVYYKGNILDKTKFTGGTISFFSGVNTLNILCAVWIVYDKGSGAFHVNIVDSFTGDIPSGVSETSPVLSITDIVETSPVLQIV